MWYFCPVESCIAVRAVKRFSFAESSRKVLKLMDCNALFAMRTAEAAKFQIKSHLVLLKIPYTGRKTIDKPMILARVNWAMDT